MWRDTDLVETSHFKIVKGPGLHSIEASQQEFLAGNKHPHLLPFTTDRNQSALMGRQDCQMLCVASIDPIEGDRADLKLIPQRSGDGREYRAYNYNHRVGKGDGAELRRKHSDIPHMVMRLPRTSEMLKLQNTEFILVYGLLMDSYQDQLPCHCEFPGCDFIIAHPVDLRKLSGRFLCPEHFYVTVQNEVAEKGLRRGDHDQAYFNRVAKLLPRVPLSKLVS